MQVTGTSYTVAEYCEQMREGKIIVNRDYQRSGKVWPPAAKSYLIDTILCGFPIPKLSLYQITDLKSRRTIKEIVDGQQRSETILAFADDRYRMSGASRYAGLRFSQLDEADRASFLGYQLSVDLFVNATQEQIREVFRRINSYTIPLNRQELRHATYQGAFKWFLVQLSSQYAQVLKNIGVFQEKQLSRMADAALLTDVCLTLEQGIISASEPKLDEYYRENDEEFAKAAEFQRRFDNAFEAILRWHEIHKSPLMKPFNFYTLLLAVMHQQDPVESLSHAFHVNHPGLADDELVLTKLGALIGALEDEDVERFGEWILSNAESTNRINQRRTRFIHLCRALSPT